MADREAVVVQAVVLVDALLVVAPQLVVAGDPGHVDAGRILGGATLAPVLGGGDGVEADRLATGDLLQAVEAAEGGPVLADREDGPEVRLTGERDGVGEEVGLLHLEGDRAQLGRGQVVVRAGVHLGTAGGDDEPEGRQDQGQARGHVPSSCVRHLCRGFQSNPVPTRLAGGLVRVKQSPYSNSLTLTI